MKNKGRTLLVGNFGKPNIGDELILNAALETYPEVIVMTNNSDFSQTFCEKPFECIPFFPTGLRSLLCFMFLKKRRQQLLELKERGVTQVVFPGGGLFAITFRAVLLWTIIFLWIRKILGPDMPICFEAQGVDSDLGWGSKMLIKYVFSRATRISVRDTSSKKALNKLKISAVEVVEDSVEVFLGKQTIWNRGERSQKLILINAISKINNKLSQVLFEKYKKYRKVYISFEEGDRRFVPSKFKGQVFFPKTKTELFTCFSQSEQVLGERFHCLVLGEYFCGAKHVFALKKPYSQKVKNFIQSRGIKMLNKK